MSLSGSRFVILFAFLGFLANAKDRSQILKERDSVLEGRELFIQNCSGCHGMNADGKGEAAPMLKPMPRNLVGGSFKFRTTPSGSLPTEADLIRVLDRGVLGSAMPSFKSLPLDRKKALVAYIKSLRPDWTSIQGRSLELPPPPEEMFTKKEVFLKSAGRGKILFAEACQTCHGDGGRGDGPGAEGLLDGEEQPIKPGDLTRSFIKGGYGAQDIYRAISTGLDGTPMPSFYDTYNNAQRWDIVAYVMLLRAQGSGQYLEGVK